MSSKGSPRMLFRIAISPSTINRDEHSSPALARVHGKRLPLGWRGPSKDMRNWRVIDSQGHRIAIGFATRAYALRWMDSFDLIQAGYRLNEHDREWFLSYWLSLASARPARRARRTRSHAPTESGRYA